MDQQLNFFEEKELSQTSLTELQDMVKKYAHLRKEKEALAKQASDKEAQIDEMEAKIMSVLEASNMEKFPVPGIGTVYTSERFQVSFPKDAEQAATLRAFCMEHGLANELTINHQRLNAIYKARKEERNLKGEMSLDDILPGVGEPRVFKSIGLRKG